MNGTGGVVPLVETHFAIESHPYGRQIPNPDDHIPIKARRVWGLAGRLRQDSRRSCLEWFRPYRHRLTLIVDGDEHHFGLGDFHELATPGHGRGGGYRLPALGLHEDADGDRRAADPHRVGIETDDVAEKH